MKNKYVVAFLNTFQGEIEMCEVSATDELDAMLQVLEIDPAVFNSEDTVHQYCADTDMFIGVYKL